MTSETTKILKRILIVGGSSGLGLELAKKYRDLGHTLFITGRTDPKLEGVTFVPFEIGTDLEQVKAELPPLIEATGVINTLIYAAGFYQEGHLADLDEEQIVLMMNVGLVAPTLLVRALQLANSTPLKVMLITSSSQYTPREMEPTYTAAKAGLGMLGASLGLDPTLGKVLVVAPGGMKTPFWRDQDKDQSAYLDPNWVADQIIDVSGGPFKYRFVKIHRDPPKVEVVETRQG